VVFTFKSQETMPIISINTLLINPRQTDMLKNQVTSETAICVISISSHCFSSLVASPAYTVFFRVPKSKSGGHWHTVMLKYVFIQHKSSIYDIISYSLMKQEVLVTTTSIKKKALSFHWKTENFLTLSTHSCVS
jgi:hypothetical protein